MSNEDLRKMASRGGKARGRQRREESVVADDNPMAGIVPGLTLEDIAAVVGPALTATYEHDGSIDWNTRLSAAAVVSTFFRRYPRPSPEEVCELLERALPEAVMSPEMKHRLQTESIYASLRASFWAIKRYDSVRGIYAAELPRNYVEPWASYDEVVAAERPPDISPDEPEEGEIVYLPGGRVLYRGVLMDGP